MTFQSKLIFGVCGLVLLTGGIVLWLSHRSAKATTEELTGSIFHEVSQRAVAHTRGFVLQAAPVVESLVQLADKGIAIDDHDRIAPQLLAVLKANPGLSWVSYGDENGEFSGAYRTLEGGMRINQSHIVDGKTKLVEQDVLADGTWKEFKKDEDSGYDPRTRPFYTKAKEKGRLVWLQPYIFYKQGVPGISCAAPVKDASGKLRGVLSVDFDLNALSEFVSTVSVSKNSRVFLFTNDQFLLAYPDLRKSDSNASHDSAKLPTLADIGDPLVDNYRKNLKLEHSDTNESHSFDRFEFQHDGIDYLGSTTAFRVGEDLDWVVGVFAPNSDFVGNVWKTQAFALAAAVGAVLAAILLAFALARTVSRPVSSMIGFMKQVGDGNLETKAEFGASGEFKRLADALNQMITDLRDRIRMRHSLGVAMEVQQRLLPSESPTIRGLQVTGHSTYCDETGGDYYDFLVLDSTSRDSVLIALGDVMGHGVAAALVMAGVRSVLRDRAGADGDLAILMSRLNRLLSDDHGGDRFMTMHLSIIDGKTQTMRWVSAGHDPVIVYDPESGKFNEIGEGELPLGIVDETEYTEQSNLLQAGQVLFIGTDGVWELPNKNGELFGKDRLRGIIRETAAETTDIISNKVREQLMIFRGDAKSVDDITFVVVKVLQS